MSKTIELDLLLTDLIFSLDNNEAITQNCNLINTLLNDNEITESDKLSFLSKLIKNILNNFSGINQEEIKTAFNFIKNILNKISVFNSYYNTEDFIDILQFFALNRHINNEERINYLENNVLKLENINELHIKYALAVHFFEIILKSGLMLTLKKELIIVKNIVKELKDKQGIIFFGIPIPYHM